MPPLRLALCAVALMLVPSAVAHVPLVEPRAHALDASRSWAIYASLGTDEVDTWTFDLRQGERIFLLIAVPLGAEWVPDATLAGPEGPIVLRRVDRVGYESATPYAARNVWELDRPAPATGEYSLRVGGDGGRYALGFGLNEGFTPIEWITVPVMAVRIHAWQGQPIWLLALPYMVAVAVATPLIFGTRHSGTEQMLARTAAALLAGGALERALQLAIALNAGASPGAFGYAFTGATIIVASLLAFAAWNARRPPALLAIAGASLAAWAGLLAGPLLAVAASARAAARLRHRSAPRPADGSPSVGKRSEVKPRRYTSLVIVMANRMNWIDVTALALVVIGALNWGLVGFFEYDLVAELLGAGSTAARIVYVLVGIAGIYTIWTAVKAGQEASHRIGSRPT